MDITIFLAQVFGIYFVLNGVAVLLRPALMKDLAHKVASEPSFIFLGGALTMLIAVPLVLLHNVWGSTLEIVVSVIVWATLVKGLIRLFAPDLVVQLAGKLVEAKWFRAALILLVLVGVYLVYAGFGLGA